MSLFLNIIKAAIYGVVQGITEWLPISSTGHLILMNSFLPLNLYSDAASNEAFWNMFKVVIQFGSILAVLMIYWNRLNPFNKSLTEKKKRSIYRLWIKIIIACVPAGVAGILLDDLIDSVLSSSLVIAFTLILYGVLFIWMENRETQYTVEKVKDITPKKAFLVGCFQMLALIPGTSRSGATIIGGILLGMSRKLAAEYTFFLAIPVMFGASFLKLIKFGLHFTGTEVVYLLLGMVVAFGVSIAAIKFLMGYIKKHDFKVFGWYRIALGVVVLAYFLLA